MFADFDNLEKQLAGVGLADLFEDNEVTDLLFVGPGIFYVDRMGILEPRDSPFIDANHFQAFLERIIVPTGRRPDARYPFLDGALADGSRFHLVFPPASTHGPVLSIRKLRRSRSLKLQDFIDPKDQKVIESLVERLSYGENILVSGGTGVGKTTFLGLLMNSLPVSIRWVVIEEYQELVTTAPHAVRLQGRPATADGVGEITLRMLVKNALRMRPDRLVLGECRGAEAFDLLQALMSGHGGSMGTIHASSALGALHRLEALVGLSGMALSSEAVRSWVAQSIRWVAHLECYDGRRRLAELIRLDGVELSRFRVFPWFRSEKRE